MPNIRAIIGLGNPGPEYEQTRHNAGALWVDHLARQHGQSLRPERKFHGQLGQITVRGQEVYLLFPSTFMNRSGLAAQSLAQFYRLSPEEILVAHDELDLPAGCARLKQGGGHGGHNGLRDIIKALANQSDFPRLRIGIDHPGHKEQVTGHVLGRFGKTEEQQLQAVFQELDALLPDIVTGQWPQAMNRLHRFKADTPN